MDGFIVRRGGSGGKLYAAIAVTYPAGSVCTCTNGTKTLRAKGTGGSYVFYIPEAGTWTVSCTDGTRTASRSFAISEKYQSEAVTLVYRLYIIENGVLNNAFTRHPTAVQFTQESGALKLISSENNVRSIMSFDAAVSDFNNVHIDLAELMSYYDNSNPHRPSLFAGNSAPTTSDLNATAYVMLADRNTMDTHSFNTEFDLPYQGEQFVSIMFAGQSGKDKAYARIKNLYFEVTE